ncbi:MAG: hypothetical protein H6712_13935 [Myxococcales bacterium]|nr:hypothetical protein [Myxococcales bacterium]MCB9714962.1 hypothetical protein [Myxococcales bacterium]
MRHSLEIATTSLFLLLSIALLGLWSWAVPDLWSGLDMRVAIATVTLSSVGLGWVLTRGIETTDPEPT